MELTGRHELSGLTGPILLTGHTGFKGTWLSLYLKHLGIQTIGYSLRPTIDSLYARIKDKERIPECIADIRDYNNLEKCIYEYKPTHIIHLAAQPLVLESYKNPRETFDVNVTGTINLLDIAFKTDFVKGIVIVTTDKVYKNDNLGRKFKENDPLEGKDPYSASKVSVESVIRAWQQIARINGGPQITSVRAGNVIGGGDLAEDRLLPDLIRAHVTDSKVEIRNPQSTRPWQHVLDPLRGYLMALERISTDVSIESLNFGPTEDSLKVMEVVDICKNSLRLHVMYPSGDNEIKGEKKQEAENLSLDSTYALDILGWKPAWKQEYAINKTIEWWKCILNNGGNAKDACMIDIEHFLNSLDNQT